MPDRALSEEEKLLLADLRSSDPDRRGQATSRLWQRWFAEKGDELKELLIEGAGLMQQNHYSEALRVFDDLADKFPDFAEAHNKKATVLYLMRRYEESIRECQATVRLNPIHFGAWHGLGLCYMETGRFQDAIKAFQKALDIQPYANLNRQMIQRCQSMVN